MTAVRHFPLPEVHARESAYRMSYALARQRLHDADIGLQCRNSGASYLKEKNAASIIYLDRAYEITVPAGEVSPADGTSDVPLRDKILLLHYFLHARGTPISGCPVTYQELPAGFYYPTFRKRVLLPLIRHFGAKPERLVQAAASLGGYPAEYGDTAVTITALPRVPVTIVLWCGDEEFPAEASVLFDRSVTDYLPAEDIIVLSETIVWKLARYEGTGGDHPGRS
ncbi:MAG: DUF3786 domain-containing protein [Dehalococcoidales bacterium]|nr:DUF3786 domain-containing protein [Dehalococcoidales bacterium]